MSRFLPRRSIFRNRAPTSDCRARADAGRKMRAPARSAWTAATRCPRAHRRRLRAASSTSGSSGMGSPLRPTGRQIKDSAMDPAARQRHRQRLLALRVEILAEGDIEPEPARQDPTSVGNDEDTQALAEMSQSIASSRNRNRTEVLARVTAALARLDDDAESYGLCAECEEPIAGK